MIVECPTHTEGETFARWLDGQWWCDCCGKTGHKAAA